MEPTPLQRPQLLQSDSWSTVSQWELLYVNILVQPFIAIWENGSVIKNRGEGIRVKSGFKSWLTILVFVSDWTTCIWVLASLTLQWLIWLLQQMIIQERITRAIIQERDVCITLPWENDTLLSGLVMWLEMANGMWVEATGPLVNKPFKSHCVVLPLGFIFCFLRTKKTWDKVVTKPQAICYTNEEYHFVIGDAEILGLFVTAP